MNSISIQKRILNQNISHHIQKAVGQQQKVGNNFYYFFIISLIHLIQKKISILKKTEFIAPNGMTGIFQRLDVLIFGAIKSRQKAFMNQRVTKLLNSVYDPEKHIFKEPIPILKRLSKKETSPLLQQIWSQIPSPNFKIDSIFVAEIRLSEAQMRFNKAKGLI